MAIIYTNQRSKKKSKTKKEIAEYENWLKSVNAMTTNFSRGKTPKKSIKKTEGVQKLSVPPGRETPKYPSLNSPGGSTTKPIQGKVYTGTAMKGIGTLHKSNAVPIFDFQEAVDMANMRR